MSDEEKVLSDLKDIVEYFMRLYREEEDHHIYAQHYDRMVVVSNACNLIEELLKAQEPRVLTREEADAIAHQTEETAIYLERKSDKSLYAAIAGDTQGRVPNISWLGEKRNYLSEYGKTWRCWSARPTDEQREAVPWDD